MLTDDAVALWTTDGPQPMLSLPLPALRRGSLYENAWDQVVSTGYDPVSNTLLWHMEYESVRHGSRQFSRRPKPKYRTQVLRLDDCQLPAAAVPPSRPGSVTARPLDGAVEERVPQCSFYLVEFSIHLQGDQGFFYLTADRDEVREVLDGQPDAIDDDLWQDIAEVRYAFLTDGQTICVWTVQAGTLADGLDITPFLRVHNGDGTTSSVADVRLRRESGNYEDDEEAGSPQCSLDWNAVATRLPTLQSPLGPPLTPDAKNLGVIIVGPHPAPDIDSYLDLHLDEGNFRYGPNQL
jgi:hypothetical protein